MVEGPIETRLDSLSCLLNERKERLCGIRVVVSYGCEIGNGVGLKTTLGIEKEIATLGPVRLGPRFNLMHLIWGPDSIWYCNHPICSLIRPDYSQSIPFKYRSRSEWRRGPHI